MPVIVMDGTRTDTQKMRKIVAAINMTPNANVAEQKNPFPFPEKGPE